MTTIQLPPDQTDILTLPTAAREEFDAAYEATPPDGRTDPWLADLFQQAQAPPAPELAPPAPVAPSGPMTQFLSMMDLIARDQRGVPASAFVVEAILNGEPSFVWVLRTPQTNIEFWLVKCVCQWLGGEMNPHLNRLAMSIMSAIKHWFQLTYLLFNLTPPTSPAEFWRQDGTGQWTKIRS